MSFKFFLYEVGEEFEEVVAGDFFYIINGAKVLLPAAVFAAAFFVGDVYGNQLDVGVGAGGVGLGYALKIIVKRIFQV